MPASKFRGLVSAMYLWVATLCLQCHYYYVPVAEATTAVDESGKTWQLLSNAWWYFAFFALCLLLFLALLAGHHFCQHFRQLLLLISSVVLFLIEWGTGRNGHGVVVEWTSACMWCLVSACSSSWYVLLRIFICTDFFWAPEHLCDHGLDRWDQLMWEFNQPIDQCCRPRYYPYYCCARLHP